MALKIETKRTARRALKGSQLGSLQPSQNKKAMGVLVHLFPVLRPTVPAHFGEAVY